MIIQQILKDWEPLYKNYKAYISLAIQSTGHYFIAIMRTKKILVKNIYTAILIFIIASCDFYIYSQNPGDLFSDGKMPHILNELANPRPTLGQTRSIIAHRERVKRNQERRLRVAVIDNGTDYLHPGLIHNIEFRVKNGEIKGVGIDLLGGDTWPHPNLIDPRLFAFGAKGTDEEGRIISPQENPVALFHRMNSKFMSLLETAVKEQPQLKESLFNKINAANFTLAAAQKILKDPFDYNDSFVSSYEESKRMGVLWSRSARLNENLKATFENLDKFELAAKKYLDRNWVMRSSGAPDFNDPYDPKLMSTIEGADIFYQVLKETYHKFSNQNGYEAYYQPLKKFIDSIQYDISLDSLTKPSEGYTVLQEAWYAIINDFQFSDPLVYLVNAFQHGLNLEEYQVLFESNLSTQEKNAFIKARYEIAYDMAKQWQNHQLENNPMVIATEKKGLRQSLAEVDSLKGRFFDYMDQRGWEKFYQNGWLTGKPFSDSKLHANYAVITQNPYLNRTSVSHGTHTSSIVVANEPSVDIVPIRILVEGKNNSEQIHTKLVNDFLSQFQEWLNTPLVATAIEREYARNFLSIFHSRESSYLTQNQRQQLQTKLGELAKTVLSEELFDMALELEFFDQLTSAIEYVGEQKIKLSSISLGSKFTKANPPSDEGDYGQIQRDIIRFLFYEYFKYQIGLTVERHAPRTLFFVSAGNGGGWSDGQEKNALPADISSPFLARTEGEVGERAINNQLDNIVAVISLKEKSLYLSSFTDLPLSKVPTVMAVGDPVNGAVAVNDSSGAIASYNRQFKDRRVRYISLHLDDEEDRQAMIDLGWIDGDLKSQAMKREFDEAHRKIHMFYNSSYYYFSSILEKEFAARSIIAHNELRGTSMASPNATGFSARLIREKMDEMGIGDYDIYDHPEFTPKKILAMLYGHTQDYGGESLVQNAQKITDTIPYKEVPKVPIGLNIEYANYIKQLIGIHQ